MKQLLYVIALVLVMILFATSSFAQKSKVPVTYKGDTDEAIARRAQWVEGAKKEKILIWWGTGRVDLNNKLIDRFRKIYPFIKVEYWRGRGEEIAAKLEAEVSGGIHTVDIMLGGEPYNYPRWRKMGIIAKYTDIIPGIKKIPRNLYSKFGDWFIAGNNGMVPQFNTNMVSGAEAPKSWENLLDPKWKGHIGLTPDTKAWSTLAIAEGGWGVERTEKFLRELAKQDLIWTRGHSAGQTLMIAGEFKIFAEAYTDHLFKAQDKGAPVNWIRVSPVPITGASYTLQMNAPHPNAARLFLEWQFSPQGLVAYEEIIQKGSPFPGAGTRLSKALEGLDLCVRTEEVMLRVNELGLADRFSKALGISN